MKSSIVIAKFLTGFYFFPLLQVAASRAVPAQVRGQARRVADVYGLDASQVRSPGPDKCPSALRYVICCTSAVSLCCF